MNKVILAVKYVEGDLSELEYDAFEHAVKHDSELQGYLNSYREINNSVGEQLKEALTFTRPKNANLEDNEVYVAEKITYGLDYVWFFGWALAAIIALLVWQPWRPNLYEEFGFNHDKIASALIKAPYQEFDKAAQFITQKDYYQAKLIVSKKFIQNPEDFKLVSYYSMLLIADNSLETSREVLYPFATGNSLHKNDASYMLALSYLKDGDMENCKNWLKKVAVNSNPYQQSVQLLRKLDAEIATNRFNFS